MSKIIDADVKWFAGRPIKDQIRMIVEKYVLAGYDVTQMLEKYCVCISRGYEAPPLTRSQLKIDYKYIVTELDKQN